MPPKSPTRKVTQEKNICSKINMPSKGVGGPIVESVELKRRVTQTPKGYRVSERAIEECQNTPGVSLIEKGTNIYYFDPLEDGVNAINEELGGKCNEMDLINQMLAESELKLAKLDAELEKFNILGEQAIKEAAKGCEKPKTKIISNKVNCMPKEDINSLDLELEEICRQFRKDENRKNNSNCETGNEQCLRKRPVTLSPPRRSPVKQNLPSPICMDDISTGTDSSLDSYFTACSDESEDSCSNAQCLQLNQPLNNTSASSPPKCKSQNDDCEKLLKKLPLSKFDQCIAACEKINTVTSKPKLFSSLVNGKRCFPDISEIPPVDQNLYMAERDAYLIFCQTFVGRGKEDTFIERSNEFEEFFHSYINGTAKITIPKCPPKQSDPKSLQEINQIFANIQKIELEPFLQRNVLDLAVDCPDNDPDVIALLIHQIDPVCTTPEIVGDLLTPYQLKKQVHGSDARYTSPGSIVPRKIPVQDIKENNHHKMDDIEAVIKSYELPYPNDSVATSLIEDVDVKQHHKKGEHKPETIFKYPLELHPFRVETFFQLRGSDVPSWYPGMFTVFPGGNSSVKLVRTPSNLIITAWKLCAP